MSQIESIKATLANAIFEGSEIDQSQEVADKIIKADPKEAEICTHTDQIEKEVQDEVEPQVEEYKAPNLFGGLDIEPKVEESAEPVEVP